MNEASTLIAQDKRRRYVVGAICAGVACAALFPANQRAMLGDPSAFAAVARKAPPVLAFAAAPSGQPWTPGTFRRASARRAAVPTAGFVRPAPAPAAGRFVPATPTNEFAAATPDIDTPGTTNPTAPTSGGAGSAAQRPGIGPGLLDSIGSGPGGGIGGGGGNGGGDDVTPAAPEPATWIMMVLGIGLIAGLLRRARAAERAGTLAINR